MDRLEDEPPGRTCSRTVFLERLLDDRERGRTERVETYLALFPEIADFVRSEFAAFCSPGSETDSAAVADRDCPLRIGRYEIRRSLGEGGMGRVFEAYDPELRRRVVVKCLRPDLESSGQARQRLRREARLLGQVVHPNLTRVIDLIESDGHQHLVLSYHEGRTLGELVNAARQRSEAGPRLWLRLVETPTGVAEDLRRLIAYFVLVAEALAAAHAEGIVHRDLKPQNLLVTPEGAPVVLDFGLALGGAEDRLTVAGELLGTPLYMAPEQIEGDQADARTDVYALGVTVYEALTLIHPFAGAGGRAAAFQRILRGDPVPLRRHRPMIPRDLEAVVLRAMERVPARRYSNMRAFADDLQRVLDLQPTEARPVSGLGLVWRRMRRRPGTVSLALGCALALGFGTWAWLNRAHNLGIAAIVQSRAENLERTLAEQTAGLPTAEARRRLEEGVRALIEASRSFRGVARDSLGLAILYPRGLVLPPKTIVWAALPEHDGGSAGRPLFHIDYRYRVSLESDGLIRREWVDQRSEDRLGIVELPSDLILVPGVQYTVTVRVEKFTCTLLDPEQATAEEHALLAEINRLTPEILSAEGNCRPQPMQFGVDSRPAPGVRGLAELDELAVRGLWSDLLLRLGDPDATDAIGLGRVERLQRIERAARELGDEAQAARANAARTRPLMQRER